MPFTKVLLFNFLYFRFSKVCGVNYYKETRGTHACIPCPKNTVSESSRTKCKCRNGHYYRSTESGPCKSKFFVFMNEVSLHPQHLMHFSCNCLHFFFLFLAIPSRPKNPSYIRLPLNAIRLHWNISRNEALAHPDLRFRVTCRQYYETIDLGTCRNLSLGVRGTNVSKTALEIKYLLNNTNYTFSIAALNNVSVRVSEKKWNVATVHVQLAGNPVPVVSLPSSK